MEKSRIQYLIERFFQNTCTQQEKVELAKWIEESSHDDELKQIMDEKWMNFESRHKIAPDRAGEILAAILKNKVTDIGETVPIVKRLSWWRISAAASIILFVAAVSFFLVYKKPEQGIANNVDTSTNNQTHPVDDVSPGKTKAILTLSDGSTVVLDNTPDGTLAVQGNTKILNEHGQLIYNNGLNSSGEILYNTLTTHRGEQFPLQLSDGTKLWLNASSSIRFPVAFAGNERRVEITGEAYFEVAKNANKPFKVLLNGMEIVVLGTHFNVNGYADEASVRTTLLEGSVKITKDNASLLLVRGQQAKLNRNGRMDLIEDADIEQAVSWKEGYFHYNKADLETVMREVSRWYDVDIIYENESRKSEQHFSGDIQKSLTLSAVLRVLEKSLVHFRIEGKKLIVSK